MADTMKTVGAVLASAITGVGGHFLNRRWDRAIVFFALLLMWVVGGPAAMMWSMSAGDYSSVSPAYYVRVLVGGFLAIWLVSAAVTAFDSIRATTVTIKVWTPTAVVGAILVSVIGLGIASQHVLYYMATHSENRDRSYSAESEVHRYSHISFFSSSLSYGGRPAYSGEPPPAGEGTITGRVFYDGRPAAGVGLHLFLNGQYRTEKVETDAEGRYQVHVPPGTWRLNSIQADGWNDKPDGEFLMVSGREALLQADGSYDSRAGFNARPLHLEVSAGQPGAIPDIEIRPRILMLAPTGDAEVPSWREDALKWEAYPDAQTYLVEIASVTREGTSRRHRPMLTRTSAATELPLVELPAGEVEGTESEYSVSLRAFDADGRFLSESSYFAGAFRLKGHMLLGDAGNWPGPGDQLDASTFETQRKNAERVKVVRVLIEEGLFESAETLLERLQGPVDVGEKEALEGYLRAEQGRCDEARSLFDAAKDAGKRCIPERYEAGCANRPSC